MELKTCATCSANLVCLASPHSVSVKYCPVCKMYVVDIVSDWVRKVLYTNSAGGMHYTEKSASSDVCYKASGIQGCLRNSSSLSAEAAFLAYEHYVDCTIRRFALIRKESPSFITEIDHIPSLSTVQTALSGYLCKDCANREGIKVHAKIACATGVEL